MIKKGIFLLPLFLLGCLSVNKTNDPQHRVTPFTARHKLCPVRWMKMMDEENLIVGIEMSSLNDRSIAWLTRFCNTTSLYLSETSKGVPITVWAVPNENKSKELLANCYYRVKGIWKGTDMRLELEHTETPIYDLCQAMKSICDTSYNERLRRQRKNVR